VRIDDSLAAFRRTSSLKDGHFPELKPFWSADKGFADVSLDSIRRSRSFRDLLPDDLDGELFDKKLLRGSGKSSSFLDIRTRGPGTGSVSSSENVRLTSFRHIGDDFMPEHGALAHRSSSSFE
jgi:hypothetical protein